MNNPRLYTALGVAFLVLTAVYATALVANAADGSAEVKGPVVLPPEVVALPVEQAILTAPPSVPAPIKRKHAARVVINLEVREIIGRLADGVQYTFWTYGGSVPGSFLRVREGDVVEFHLNNHPSSKLPHNIDLHAVTGPGGGSTATSTAPGQSSQFTFQALNPGLYVYHCATNPVPMHVGNGMYGLILVEPKEGLPAVDKEYYVMQGEFYTTGKHGEEGVQSFDLAKALDERPPYIVFNGAVGSLVGDKALTAKVGETVRIFFGVGGPNLTSSFHIIGEIFDQVYAGGSLGAPVRNLATTLVPAGGTAMLEFKVDVPGTFILVDHSLTRAFNKGALGMLKVAGTENRVVYSGKEIDASYLGVLTDEGVESAQVQAELSAMFAVAVKSDPKLSKLSSDIQHERGKQVYMGLCFACHQPDGKGLSMAFPPLAGSDYLLADRERAIRVVLKGLSGPITVNGVTINSIMPPQEALLTDAQVADVLTYVYNSWGNKGDAFTPDQVKVIRNESR